MTAKENETSVAQHDWQERLSVVIPAFNEQDGIGQTLDNLRHALPDVEIIVVDDGSSDETAAIIRKYKDVRLIKHTANRGYGASLKTGMRFSNRDYVAWFDADNEHKVGDLKRIVDRLDKDNLVAVIGSRINRGSSLIRNVGKFIITHMGRTLKHKIGDDLNCGLRAFRRDVIVRYLNLLPNGYSASMTSLIIMLEKNYPMAFETIQTNPRLGSSKVRLWDGLKTIMLLLRITMLFAPLRIFLGMGTSLIAFGAAYSAFIMMLVGEGVPIFGALVIIVGFLVSMMGLLADQVSQLRLSMMDDATEYLAHEISD